MEPSQGMPNILLDRLTPPCEKSALMLKLCNVCIHVHNTHLHAHTLSLSPACSQAHTHTTHTHTHTHAPTQRKHSRTCPHASVYTYIAVRSSLCLFTGHHSTTQPVAFRQPLRVTPRAALQLLLFPQALSRVLQSTASQRSVKVLASANNCKARLQLLGSLVVAPQLYSLLLVDGAGFEI